MEHALLIDVIWLTNDQLQLLTDASGVWGYGSVLGNQWFHWKWNDEWLQYNITVKEQCPIVLSL